MYIERYIYIYREREKEKERETCILLYAYLYIYPYAYMYMEVHTDKFIQKLRHAHMRTPRNSNSMYVHTRIRSYVLNRACNTLQNT